MRISVKIFGKKKMKQSMEKIIISLLTIAQTGNKILFMPVQSQLQFWQKTKIENKFFGNKTIYLA